REVAPGLDVTTELHCGPAGLVLRDGSPRAALLVLGSRGRGGFTGLLAGSVAVTLAAHGHCPIVVVRGGEPEPDGPVVVGVDGSATSDAAVALAFEEAAIRGCDLMAVHAWADHPVLDDPHPEADPDAPIERAHEVLAERVA